MFDLKSILYYIFAGTVVCGIYLYKKKGASPFNYSATPTLDTFSTDFTKMASEGFGDPVVGREEEVLRLAQVLSRRSKNNAILIGSPGVGKTAIVEGLAQRIVKNQIPEELRGKRLLSLEVASLLSGTKYRGEFEERAKRIVREISSAKRNIILFIDEVQSVIQSQGTEGAVNFSDILKPALARGDLQMIGATTVEEYEKYIKSDPSLERRFQPIEVRETNEAETLEILRGVIDKYREYHRVEFTDAALLAAVVLTKQKIMNRKLPDKAIDVIDEAASMVKVSHIDKVTNGVLHLAGLMKNPDAMRLWREIQNIDNSLQKSSSREEKIKLEKVLKDKEKEILRVGILTVDSEDIDKVVNQWAANID